MFPLRIETVVSHKILKYYIETLVSAIVQASAHLQMVIVCTFISHIHPLAFRFEQYFYELHRHVVFIIFHCTLVFFMFCFV